jgi:glutamate synthase domain-containing protein 1/glutamate synthase domain-containing protein 3
MDRREIANKILTSRKPLRPANGLKLANHQNEAEGGCGVIGIACSEKIAARHLLQSLEQMRNRGNGKGGGLAAVGLVAEEFGVSETVLENDYLLAIAFQNVSARTTLERDFIHPIFEVDHIRLLPHIEDYQSLEGLDVKPPEVYQYFVRLKQDVVDEFAQTHQLAHLQGQQIEDEIVYQNSYRLNKEYYSATGEKKAFVLSHGKNMLVLKMVGYGDDVIRYYQFEDMHAHVWIGHHRYPTKGKVWHPGGAHPFVGLNEALVHNGDFANYASITEYLSQRNIFPLFLTDTEVSVLVFDLLHRIYDYPLEYVIEALAPTTERDFTLLPADKKGIYEMLQVTHMHSSPDGPWFFLIAQSDHSSPELLTRSNNGRGRAIEEDLEAAISQCYRLIGITDTSMLRPQVFAWQETSEDGPAIGFAASEKQAIDAALESLALEDTRFWTHADRYWNARGGSHTDGGAFIFSVYPNGGESARLVCTDKFGRQIRTNTNKIPYAHPNGTAPDNQHVLTNETSPTFPWLNWDLPLTELLVQIKKRLPKWEFEDVFAFLKAVKTASGSDDHRQKSIDLLTWLIDQRYPTGQLRRSSLLSIYNQCFSEIVDGIRCSPSPGFVYTSVTNPQLNANSTDTTVVIDARGFEPEGANSLALEIKRLIQVGFCKIIVAHARGHRFIGNGVGPQSAGIRLDVYGSSGDYLASGIDGLELYVHANAQDQLAQIMKSGKLVVYGDVGQTFMYAAKGGEAYVLGNAAGRPLINAVGKPRVVINGTCLDYLAESFMAGDPLNGGGFVILNGITFDEDGSILELDTPYPGGNLFSLASGGAIYVRDPHQKITADQLNGGVFAPFGVQDWNQILPYLEENERLFGISISTLLEIDGQVCPPEQVYRNIQPKAVRALQAEEAWVRKHE